MEDYELKYTDIMVGVPTMALLQAKNYAFKVSLDTFTMKVPTKGMYVDLDSTFFSEADGEFNIYEEGALNIAVLSKVLFATKKYPLLEDGQMFCPLRIELDGEEVVVYGQIVDLVNTED